MEGKSTHSPFFQLILQGSICFWFLSPNYPQTWKHFWRDLGCTVIIMNVTVCKIWKHTVSPFILTLLCSSSLCAMHQMVKTMSKPGRANKILLCGVIFAYRMTTSYLLMMLPKELFLMAKPLPMTTQDLHSSLWRNTTHTHTEKQKHLKSSAVMFIPPTAL